MLVELRPALLLGDVGQRRDDVLNLFSGELTGIGADRTDDEETTTEAIRAHLARPDQVN